MIVRNEFASARVTLDESGNGPRLLIEDLRTGARQYFDALQLVSLAEADPQDWQFILDPARLLREDLGPVATAQPSDHRAAPGPRSAELNGNARARKRRA